jgi:dTDP-4-amino-4,6-dideoxygalactose transaminase
VRGRHVLISNFTFAATLDAVILAGGIPVVCDIDQESLTLDINIVATALRDGDYDIAAVVPTRVFGMVTDLSELITLCDGKNIQVVVDAAASYPSRANLWNFSRSALYEVFSLHATKVFGIGEGGLVIGNSESIDKLRQISNFGLTTDGSLKFTDGLNAKADEFTSARALARLQDYSNDVVKRHDFIKLYKNVFNSDSRVRMMHDNPETTYSYFPIIFESEELLLSFRTAISPFIMSRRYYFPTIKTGYIGNASIVFNSKLTFSESLAKRILCLPVYASYTKEVKLEIQNLLKKTMEKIN